MMVSSEGFVFVAAEAAAAKTAAETVVLEVGGLLPLTDHFVVTSGRNDRQVRAIVDEVERRVREAGGGRPRGVEGIGDARWVLLDYGDFVVHVFDEEARAFYALERLWGDVPRVVAAGGRELVSAGA
jgi:ribosome-associated protein